MVRYTRLVSRGSSAGNRKGGPQCGSAQRLGNCHAQSGRPAGWRVVQVFCPQRAGRAAGKRAGRRQVRCRAAGESPWLFTCPALLPSFSGLRLVEGMASSTPMTCEAGTQVALPV